MLKLVIFDWDGTLVDSMEKIVTCVKVIAQRRNIPVPDSQTISALIGLPA